MFGLLQIPRTSQATDGKGVYTVFNIHLNGLYLGSLRYSQLFSLYQELKANFDCKRLEEFPPKHWRSTLSDIQLDERRSLLERFMHSVMQDRVISISDMLKEFLVATQKSCSDVTEETSRVEVYLVNGKKVNFEAGTFDRTDQVLERACAEIQVASELTYYFGLFIEGEDTASSTWNPVRPLTDYECPVVSLNTVSKDGSFRLTIRKNFWDATLVPSLISDKNAKNLLYIEALNAVSLGHWEVDMETMEQLTTLRKKGQKKEYLEAVSTLPQYGYLQLDGLTFDQPKDGLVGSVRIGKMETVSYTSSNEEWGEDLKKCQHYSLIRMKSWKVVHQHGVAWLRIQYQYGANEFYWLTIRGDQAIHLALCLHSTVNELLRMRNKQTIRKPGDQPIKRQTRDFPRVNFCQPPPLSPTVEAVDSAPSDQSSVSPTSGSSPIGQRSSLSSSTENTSEVHQQRLSSSSSASGGSSLSKGSISKPKKSSSKTPKISEAIENPTFAFGGDDDL